MKILHIIPGSGGSFYCGNCLRDSKYVDALRKSDHEVVKIPMYLPLFAHDNDQNEVPVFYGAVSIYLKQLYPVFRKAPKWLDRWLNSKPLLKMAAGMAGSTNAKGLEEMTVSMLLGEEGKQHEELERMVDWIADHCRPDVVHLSNALLLGLASRIKRKLNTVLVCSLQDEDVWVDGMDDQYRKEIWKLMQEKAKEVDAFIGVSDFYSAMMKGQLALPDHKVHSIHIGVDPDDYPVMIPSEKKRNIGYISRMCSDNGLDILVEAFILLKKEPDMQDVRLRLTGGSTGADKRFIRMVKDRISETNLEASVIWQDDFEDDARLAFFKEVSILSVPVRRGEAFGLYLCESMASGVPVVQPALGAFPEIIQLSGGGINYEPNDPETISASLAELLRDPARLDRLSLAGREGVNRHFNIFRQSEKNIALYQQLIQSN